MGRYWALAPQMGAEIDLPLTQVTGLLRKLGLSGRHAVAEQLLRLVGSRVPLAQCAIFSYEGGGRPRIVAIGDQARLEQALADSAAVTIYRQYVDAYGLGFSQRREAEVTLPAYRGSLDIEARRIG